MPVFHRLPNAHRDEQIAQIAEAALQIRIQDLKLVHYAGAGHIGGDLSAIDILATLYGAVLEITPETVDDPERDRFILSKGHIAGALYEGLKRGIARLLGRPDPGHVDVAKLLPVAYVVGLAMLVMGVVLIVADIVVPLRLS